MRLNVLKVSRIFERRIIPIQILHPAINIRIIVLQRKSGEKKLVRLTCRRGSQLTLIEPRLHLK